MVVAACAAGGTTERRTPTDPAPTTLDEFVASATRVLEETGVPGAGLALVGQHGVEWAGGVGHADRDRKTLVTADTHFRAGSISKSFVAMALVQLSEDGRLDLDAALEEVAPDIRVDNPWQDTDPVRVIHVLQHTAGFDDMHFKDRYLPGGAPPPPLAEVLTLTTAARRVRWRPGTRTAYSNVGYGVAGALIEKVAGEPYEDVIKREIFDPLAMATSSFRLTSEDLATMATGYGDAGPVGYPQIYLRPAGNLHTSAGELARFVQMLLGWGELGTAFVVDPEYLGNMEQPRTTLAFEAGLRNGYGSGIRMVLSAPFKILGHNGGIDGFVSSYGYSPSRDVGYVALLNSAGGRAPEALERISALAMRYLKRDVDRPSAPEARVDAATLDGYAGYYHDANPRHQIMWPLQWLTAGQTVWRDGHQLYVKSIVGARMRLIPVTDTSFRIGDEVDASRVFTHDREGTLVMAGPGVFAERRPRWRVELVRLPVLAAFPIILSVPLGSLVWLARVRRARPRGFWALKLALLLCSLALVLPAVTLVVTPERQYGERSATTMTVWLASLAVPLLGVVVGLLVIRARRVGASRWLTAYAALVAISMVGLSLYLGAHGLLGLRLWDY